MLMDGLISTVIMASLIQEKLPKLTPPARLSSASATLLVCEAREKY